ncbi:hypothetical protein KP509_09G028900 [Ceratopteris richardii]|uniref:Auxin-responsive protein n=1 Tax=Ceratopteris richardii TaxID=49495 RepID=A0A8T2TZ56_CERRI|nr:hypothetical protein KP509_09G028900 [Ceratopteris richardii]
MMQEASTQRYSILEERDYIGLSSSSSDTDMESRKEENIISLEPDLQLGLGLGLAVGSSCKQGAERRVMGEDLKMGISTGCASNQIIGKKREFPEASWHIGQGLELDTSSEQSATGNAPPPKDQIVGWPPVRLFRRQVVCKPVENFVKVNMDGMTVGRKVDLHAHESYEGLLQALEEMFQPPNGGREGDLKHFLLASEPEFVLTYEDQDGDWMLVGDVPWSMFTSTVKRLRITRGLEANGTATRRLPVPKAIFTV